MYSCLVVFVVLFVVIVVVVGWSVVSSSFRPHALVKYEYVARPTGSSNVKQRRSA